MFEKFIENKKIGGINCLIWKNGQTLLQKSYGYKDLDTQELMTIDSLFRISSMKYFNSKLRFILSKNFYVTDSICLIFCEEEIKEFK